MTETTEPRLPKRRIRECVENWPEAQTGEYNPACCRFPKSCSATVYDPEHVKDEELEPAPAVPEPTSPPINKENARRLADGIASMGPFMRRRATELGERMAAVVRKTL